MNYPALFSMLLPDVVVLLTLFACLTVDYGWLRQAANPLRHCCVSGLACMGMLSSLLLLLCQIRWFPPICLGQGQLVLTPVTLSAKALIFGLAAIVILLSSREHNISHVGEYYALLLLSALGAGFLACTENVLLLFVALELMSLSLYALTAFNKNSHASAEAAIKYFTFGAVSSAFLLFGLSYVYGTTQTLNLQEASVVIASLHALPPYLCIGILLIVVGLGFKIAMAPFHFWAPDVYQHAPTPIAGWIASASKIAAFLVLIKLLQPVSTTPGCRALWAGAITCCAALSLVLGNLGALRQKDVKRLLAYSSIGHAGYMLTGLLGGPQIGVPAVLFYVSLYAIANLGAFGVLQIMCHQSVTGSQMQSLAGCWKRQPFLALLLGLFLLSLAGIPPLAGFIGKFYLFFAAIHFQPTPANWHDGYYWLVALALLSSAISLYYYLRVLKICFVSDPADNAHPIEVSLAEWVVLALLGFLILVGGLFPGPLMDFLSRSSALI